MGLILDSSAIIVGERKGQSAADVLAHLRTILGPEPIALSTVSVISIPFQDLVIGVTALEFDYAVATHNIRHFQMIPNLAVKQL